MNTKKHCAKNSAKKSTTVKKTSKSVIKVHAAIPDRKPPKRIEQAKIPDRRPLSKKTAAVVPDRKPTTRQRGTAKKQ